MASKTGALKAESSTGTYRTLAAGGVRARRRRSASQSMKTALAALPEAAQVVGLVSAVNGTIRSVDIFQTPELFQSYRDGLLDSLFIDAADAKAENKPAPKPQDVKGFIDDAEKAEAKEVMKTTDSQTVQKKGKGVSSTAVKYKGAPAPAYRSYQSDVY